MRRGPSTTFCSGWRISSSPSRKRPALRFQRSARHGCPARDWDSLHDRRALQLVTSPEAIGVSILHGDSRSVTILVRSQDCFPSFGYAYFPASRKFGDKHHPWTLHHHGSIAQLGANRALRWDHPALPQLDQLPIPLQHLVFRDPQAGAFEGGAVLGIGHVAPVEILELVAASFADRL